jgi:hypothetical protein
MGNGTPGLGGRPRPLARLAASSPPEKKVSSLLGHSEIGGFHEWSTTGDGRPITKGSPRGTPFAVLELLAGFIYPQQPRVDSPPAATVAWAAAHKMRLRTGMVCGLLAEGLLVWFAGYLFSQTRPVQRGEATVAPMVLGGGVATAEVVSIAAVPHALLAFLLGQTPGIPDPTVVRLLGDLNTVQFAASATMTGVFLVAIGVAILREELGASRWLRLLAAAFNTAMIWAFITLTLNHDKWWNIVAFGAYIGFVIVVASLSFTMLRRASATRPAVAGAWDAWRNASNRWRNRSGSGLADDFLEPRL